MKVVVGFAVLCLFLFGMVLYSSHKDARQHQIDNAEKEFHAVIARSVGEQEERLVELRTQMAEMRYGRAAGMLYHLCHTDPPKTKDHQAKCKALDDRMARDDAKDAKHPW